jgi:hypothetical protein
MEGAILEDLRSRNGIPVSAGHVIYGIHVIPRGIGGIRIDE